MCIHATLVSDRNKQFKGALKASNQIRCTLEYGKHSFET